MDRLNSWKEIADYLGVTVRTAQNWERERGLPVRRLPGVARSLVSALPSELEAWRDSQSAKIPEQPARNRSEDQPAIASPQTVYTGEAMTTPHRQRFFSGRRRISVVVVAAALLLTVGLLATSRRTVAPASARLENGALVVYDSSGRELWRHSFSMALDAAAYMTNPYSREFNPSIWVGELQKGKARVLFVFRPAGDRPQNQILYCFSEDGRELWHFIPGRTVRTATETFEPFFGIRDFKVMPTAKGRMIVVSSSQYRYYPDQVAMLTPDGKLAGEYWHSGHLAHVAVTDLDHDGKSEIYLTGVDNQYRIATMVVLDPQSVAGASPQTDVRYQLLDMPIAHERARLFFKPTCISHVVQPYNVAGRMTLKDDGLAVTVWESFRDPEPATIDYDLAPDLTVRSIVPPDGFLTIHRQLELQGLLKHHFAPAELQALTDLRHPG